MPVPETAGGAAGATNTQRVEVGQLPPDPHRLPPASAWFAKDAVRHLIDRPKFCPMCGQPLSEDGITTEYWSADTRNFMTWCGQCHWFGEVVRFGMVIITEADH